MEAPQQSTPPILTVASQRSLRDAYEYISAVRPHTLVFPLLSSFFFTSPSSVVLFSITACGSSAGDPIKRQLSITCFAPLPHLILPFSLLLCMRLNHCIRSKYRHH